MCRVEGGYYTTTYMYMYMYAVFGFPRGSVCVCVCVCVCLCVCVAWNPGCCNGQLGMQSNLLGIRTTRKFCWHILLQFLGNINILFCH